MAPSGTATLRWRLRAYASNRASLCGAALGYVANFVYEVVKRQLRLSVGGLGGQGVEHFGRSEALVSGLDHQLFFLYHVHEFDTDERPLCCIE